MVFSNQYNEIISYINGIIFIRHTRSLEAFIVDTVMSSTVPSCDGQNAPYIRLISQDGHEFIIKRDYALISVTIKAMLDGPGQFAENESNQVNFREIPSHVLEKVCQYFTYKIKYTNSSTEIPDFPIAPEIALELLMAANFLDC